MILFNQQTWRYFVYNPKEGKFLSESKSTASWAQRALGWRTITCKGLEEINQYRKAVKELKLDVVNTPSSEIVTQIHNAYPEWFI